MLDRGSLRLQNLPRRHTSGEMVECGVLLQLSSNCSASLVQLLTASYFVKNGWHTSMLTQNQILAVMQAQPANTVEDAGEEARTPSTDPAETPRSTVKPSEGATEAAPAASPVPIAAEEAATEGGKVAKEKKEEAGASAPSFGAFASKAPFSWSGASAGAGFGFGGLANANGGDEFKSNGAAGPPPP